MFDIGKAIEYLKEGERVRRVNWMDTDRYLVMEFASFRSDKTCKDYIQTRTLNDYFMPWAPSHSDLLSKDWILVK